MHIRKSSYSITWLQTFQRELMCFTDYLNFMPVMHILIVCLVSESQSSDYNMFNVISHISVSQGSGYSYVLCIGIARSRYNSNIDSVGTKGFISVYGFICAVYLGFQACLENTAS